MTTAITGDAGGFWHDYGHLSEAQLRALLEGNPHRVRDIASRLYLSSKRPVAKLIDELVALRIGWPQPEIGLTW